MVFRDYYEILGLEKGIATVGDIKAAYKKAALRMHPDRNFGVPDATAQFQRLGQAVETLENTAKRTTYNTYYDKFKKLSSDLKALVERREELRQETARCQKFHHHIRQEVREADRQGKYFRLDFDCLKWTEYQDYLDFGGGDFEVAKDILKHLADRLDTAYEELGPLGPKIGYLEQLINEYPDP